MRRLKVAYLMHGIYYGGATRSLQLLLKSLNNYAVDKFVLTISSRSKEIENEIIKNVEILRKVKLSTISNNQYGYESYHNALKKLSLPIDKFVSILASLNIEILHINSTVFPHIPRKIKANLPNVKIITHVRELIPNYDDGKLQEYVIKEISEMSDKIICISENEYQYFKDSQKALVIPNSFDFSILSSISPKLRNKYHIPGNIILVGMVSHFSLNKGHLEFLKALNIIKESKIKSNFRFVIIGSKKSTFWEKLLKTIILKDNYENKVNNYIKDHRLNDLILLIPYVNTPLDYIADLDILVRPSLQADPWGRDIIEAMALKKPIIATGSSEFYIENGTSGYLVPPGDPNTLAEKILDLIKSPEKRIRYGEAGYKKIRQMCDLLEYGKKIFNIYTELIN